MTQRAAGLLARNRTIGLLARSCAIGSLAAQQPPAGRTRHTLDDGARRSWPSGDLDSEVGEQIANFRSIRSRSTHRQQL
jgi:hypothetical protein